MIYTDVVFCEENKFENICIFPIELSHTNVYFKNSIYQNFFSGINSASNELIFRENY